MAKVDVCAVTFLSWAHQDLGFATMVGGVCGGGGANLREGPDTISVTATALSCITEPYRTLGLRAETGCEGETSHERKGKHTTVGGSGYRRASYMNHNTNPKPDVSSELCHTWLRDLCHFIPICSFFSHL